MSILMWVWISRVISCKYCGKGVDKLVGHLEGVITEHIINLRGPTVGREIFFISYIGMEKFGFGFTLINQTEFIVILMGNNTSV